MKPAIVLVHGAFAESASWDKVIDPLTGAGASHAITVSQPKETAELILQAAALPATA